jgi:hypothetical protein
MARMASLSPMNFIGALDMKSAVTKIGTEGVAAE